MKAAELTENEIQAAVFKHLRQRGAPGIFAFHPKNGNSDMAGRGAGKNIGLGVEPGMPDVMVIKYVPPDDLRVFGLELKVASRRCKKPTRHEAKQDDTRERMALCGVVTGIVFGLDEALAWLERHGLLVGRAA